MELNLVSGLGDACLLKRLPFGGKKKIAQRLREIDDDDADADASDDMFHDTRYVPGPTSSDGDVGE